jgi:DNA integrity scanning protein DisA with diadenylate cyclase activity
MGTHGSGAFIPARMTTEGESARSALDTLYHELLARGIGYFFPGSRLDTWGAASTTDASLVCVRSHEDVLEFDWLGLRYRLSTDGQPLSGDRARLLTSIGRVLSARYHLLLTAAPSAETLHLFRGLPEDHYVSAFVDPAPFASLGALASTPDRVSEAIEVLRVSALTTYENRRIETGALLFGGEPDPCHALPARPSQAIRYSMALTSVRSFHRLCDGLQTLALVARDGVLLELVDVREWAQPYADMPLPVPTIERYRPHSRATLCGGHVCLVLTGKGEIKIFAGGTQVFRFLDSRWRLTEGQDKYEAWQRAIGDATVAEHLFVAALELAEDRQGALFVVLDDAAFAQQLIATQDLLTTDSSPTAETNRQFHYLLRDKRLLDVAPAVLESVARIDGAIVLDRAANFLAFGAILRHSRPADASSDVAGGGRTTAALHASGFGNVLMVSEDGVVSFFRGGRRVWQL